jgi:hypothetical protein
MRNFHQKLFFVATGLSVLLVWKFSHYSDDYRNNSPGETSSFGWYAVFACSTPGEKNHRGYDYAFYLPLTALAWERFGFRSVVQIIGTRIEWERSRPLSWILSYLEARRAIIIFLDAMIDHRPTLGQTARLFTVNMDEFPGQPDDFLITTDADLWPLDREHFVPRENKKIVLLHAMCCGFFPHNGSMYRMYPMSNIGASVQTWRKLLNDGHRFAKDSESIFQYLEDYYGPGVRVKTAIDTSNWYLDQHVVSVRIQHWMNNHGGQDVFMVSDEGFTRIDRLRWKSDIDKCQADRGYFEKMYDAHLPLNPYLPDTWNLTRPLIHLMYGNNSWQASWADDYTKGFYQIMAESRLL